jgi:CheY-like chemotaxis protein
VRYLVEMHGGSISASSEGAGRGATFTVRLPKASAAKPQQQPEGLAEAETRQPMKQTKERQPLLGLRLLVVEDDPDTLDMLKFVFQENGAAVVTVASTNEALKALERSRPDVLVSDLAMPGKDGYELITQVRSLSPDRGGNVPAVALSAYTRPEDRSRALAAGFQVHVSKPVDLKCLVDVVGSLMGSRQSS